MTELPPDPRFPHRPDHPDFWAIAEISRDLNDTIASSAQANGRTTDEEFSHRVSAEIDIQSLSYQAVQRARLALGLSGDAPTNRETIRLASVYMEAFLIGVKYSDQRRAKASAFMKS